MKDSAPNCIRKSGVLAHLRVQLSKCKSFLIILTSIIGVHVLENFVELWLARYTSINFVLLLLGSVLIPIILTIFIRMYHKHEHMGKE